MRIPMPYKIGGRKDPSNIDEKLRSEAATMITIHQRASDIPIPKLYGFGLTTGQRVRLFPVPSSMPSRLTRPSSHIWTMHHSSNDGPMPFTTAL